VSDDLDISQPATKEQLDIPFTVVQDLFLRRVLSDDTVTTTQIARSIGLARPIVDAAFDLLRDRKALDVKTMQGNDYVFSLTGIGKELCADANERSRYNSIAPVSLKTYQTAVHLQKASLKVNRSAMAEAMKDLVVAPAMLDQLGPAFNSQHSIFFYGPAGTGKTSLAERLVRLYSDWIVVPFAILVDGQYIVMMDPTVHEALPEQPEGLDPRWVACKRPLVTVGGELEASMLELQYDQTGRIYTAPLQVKANNGMMLIDDFGRQVLTPQQLLNRWIYPLSKRQDYLALANGQKFAMPFELMVAFSTNMDPNDLGDEAFFRRIQNKVFVGPMTAEMFDRVIDICVTKAKVAMEPDSKEKLRALCLSRDAIGLRANYPWDFCKMILSISEYEESAPVMNDRLMAQSAELYWGAIDSKMDARRVVGAPGAAPRTVAAAPVLALADEDVPLIASVPVSAPAPVVAAPAPVVAAPAPVVQHVPAQPVIEQPVMAQPVFAAAAVPAPLHAEFAVQPPNAPGGFDLEPSPQFAVHAAAPAPSGFPRPTMPAPAPMPAPSHAQSAPPLASSGAPLGQRPVQSIVQPPGAPGGLPTRVPLHGAQAMPSHSSDPSLLAALRSAATAGDRELSAREGADR
jgi:hypothetical protein